MMKNVTLKSAIFLFFCISFIPFYNAAQSTATYDITFTSFWNATDHGTLPGTAHWSKLVGATHNSNIMFWEVGQMASTGIENVAETGSNTVFQSEVNASITGGDTQQYIDGDGLNSATGTITINGLQVDENFSLLTLVSMIAPSPDWMIGLNSFDLRPGGNWITGTTTIDLFPYDAGTEDGSSYSISNPATVPQVNITSLINVSPFNAEKIGTLTITFVSVLGIENSQPLDKITIFPNPTRGNLAVSNIQNKNLNRIEIFNVLGSLAKTIIIDNQYNILNLNVSNLNSGVYLMRFQTVNGNQLTRKLIIE